ncbi:hypothetical protein [Mesorhizobium sp.]|uniref:hypothetical protein n=1 Tax=Mesorhizobium sp. TaxID=1871066 RepID=UPI00120B94F3|nr:hypothetical protein [Mesorhizobium sp.]TIS55795.1 MAG: hypothetical protein E5W91_20600 [Mesorhizobium sp.]TIS89805.1 MAG: hypothetical protein E5W89_14990 [Mesorhizobium sp.]
MERFGIAAAEEIDTLETRLRAAINAGATVCLPTLVGAWARFIAVLVPEVLQRRVGAGFPCPSRA